MFAFLEEYYRLTNSDDIGGLLGSMSLLPDGGPADSTIAEEWAEAVEAAVEGRVSADLQLRRE
jgi:hypothetical protein